MRSATTTATSSPAPRDAAPDGNVCGLLQDR